MYKCKKLWCDLDESDIMAAFAYQSQNAINAVNRLFSNPKMDTSVRRRDFLSRPFRIRCIHREFDRPL